MGHRLLTFALGFVLTGSLGCKSAQRSFEDRDRAPSDEGGVESSRDDTATSSAPSTRADAATPQTAPPAEAGATEADSSVTDSEVEPVDDAAAPEPSPGPEPLELGETCSSSSECESQICASDLDGRQVCCASNCSEGEACSNDGEMCAPEPACADELERCNGDHELCVDGSWTLLDPCEERGCNLERGGCLKATGELCETDEECGSGSSCEAASDGSLICCSAGCDSACSRCALTGTRCEALEDDVQCTITCPADTPCRDYESHVVENRCVAGACGGAELCAFTPRNAGQPCDALNLCDTDGNCSVPKLALGASCNDGGECSSNQCVDGICCESACNGPCMNCRPGTGRCDLVPKTDTACNAVSCSHLSDTCGHHEDLREDLCSALGECKTEKHCALTHPAPARTPCGPTSGLQICDGLGACVDPEVQCGNTACSITSSSGNESGTQCCMEIGTNEFINHACQSSCDPGTGGLLQVQCDQHSDCRTGQVCCFSNTPAPLYSLLTCSEPQDCNRAIPHRAYELCRSPQMNNHLCSNEGSCVSMFEDAPYYPWGTCTQ